MALGPFKSERIHVIRESTPRPTTPAMEAMIAGEWERRLADARRAGRLLFNGDLLRYIRHREVHAGDADSTFEMTVGSTCYRDFVGTNLFNQHRLGDFPWESFANPLGTTATLVSSDGRIVYGRRSDRVAYHAGHVHTFGGTLEAADLAADGQVDPFGSVMRELEEEVGLRPGEYEPLIFVGLVRDRDIHQPEMLFETRVNLTHAELIRRWERAEARDEHCELIGVDDDPEAIVPFVRSCGLIAPVAVAGLLLHGRSRWGEAWYRAALDAPAM